MFPALTLVVTSYFLQAPDKCGTHSISLHSSIPADLLLEWVGNSSKQGAKVPAKPSAVTRAFSQFWCSWLLAGLQIFQMFDWIYFFPLLSSRWMCMPARWSQAGAGYLASVSAVSPVIKLPSPNLSFLKSVVLCFFLHNLISLLYAPSPAWCITAWYTTAAKKSLVYVMEHNEVPSMPSFRHRGRKTWQLQTRRVSPCCRWDLSTQNLPKVHCRINDMSREERSRHSERSNLWDEEPLSRISPHCFCLCVCVSLYQP